MDKDGDGIPDDWESSGHATITLPNGKTQELDLTKDGPVSPDHKDIFVWVAWMEDSTHTHKPTHEALQIVRDAFARAPIQNLDHHNGIRLHIYLNPTALDEVPILGSGIGDNYNWTAFNSLKKKVFPKELEHKFHFCIFAHDVDVIHDSGIAVIGGYDFIVSLGAFGVNGAVAGSQSQAGTFMHELGHNLGLLHGGTDPVEHKPNYLSVMNYFFQLDGLIVDGVPENFDYSRFSLGADENALYKNPGLKPPPAFAMYGSQYFCASDPNHSKVILSIAKPVDWDCSGVIDNMPVTADVNEDGKLMKLEGANDWENLQLVPTASSHAGARPPSFKQLNQELNLKMANTIVLPPVKSVNVSKVESHVRIGWSKSPSERIVAYKVFRRSEDGKESLLGIVDDDHFIDREPSRGASSYYIRGLYVPHGGSKEFGPSEFPDEAFGKVIVDPSLIRDLYRIVPDQMRRIETMGIKPNVTRPPFGVSSLVETPLSAPGRIEIE